MKNAVMLISFKLAEGASVPDFLLAAEKVEREVMSKRKGYLSWKQLSSGDQWADLLLWETMEDAQSAMEMDGDSGNAATEAFCAFLDEKSIAVQLYSVEKSY